MECEAALAWAREAPPALAWDRLVAAQSRGRSSWGEEVEGHGHVEAVAAGG
jgi:hypothetical protein